MKRMTAADAKTKFGQFVDIAQKEPVIVTNDDQAVGVFFSMEDIENTVWAEEAKHAEKDGYLSKDESASLLNNLIHGR